MTRFSWRGLVCYGKRVSFENEIPPQYFGLFVLKNNAFLVLTIWFSMLYEALLHT
jgi:hypothetical protein